MIFQIQIPGLSHMSKPYIANATMRLLYLGRGFDFRRESVTFYVTDISFSRLFRLGKPRKARDSALRLGLAPAGLGGDSWFPVFFRDSASRCICKVSSV